MPEAPLRVLVDGNTFEHVWPSGQDGTAIVLKSVNQDGRCAWCVTEYVTFSNNVVKDAANGVMINAAEVGATGLRQPMPINHVRLENVLFQDIGGKLLRVMGGASDVAITHITSLANPGGILDPRDPSDRKPRVNRVIEIGQQRLDLTAIQQLGINAIEAHDVAAASEAIEATGVMCERDLAARRIHDVEVQRMRQAFP